MERSEALRKFEESEGLINIFLKQINEDIDGSNWRIFKGSPSVKTYDIAKNVGDIVKYIRDGKKDADRLQLELLNLREKTKELQQKTKLKGYDHFAYQCNDILDIIKAMERFDPIPETGENGCLSTGDNSGDKEGVESLTTDQIKAKINQKEPFLKAKASDDIPYGVYWTRLTKGMIPQANGDKKVIHVIDDEKCNLELFRLCVERADISDIITKGNKMIARLFMYNVASKFKDSDKFRKAANKAFGLDETKTRLSAIKYDYKVEFFQLFYDVFPESDPNK